MRKLIRTKGPILLTIIFLTLSIIGCTAPEILLVGEEPKVDLEKIRFYVVFELRIHEIMPRWELYEPIDLNDPEIDDIMTTMREEDRFPWTEEDISVRRFTLEVGRGGFGQYFPGGLVHLEADQVFESSYDRIAVWPYIDVVDKYMTDEYGNVITMDDIIKR